MNKTTKIIIAAIIIIAIIAVVAVILIMNNKPTKNETTNLPLVSNEEELSDLLDKVYDGVTTHIFNVETRTIDLTDNTSVKSYMGLESGENLQYAIVSEPMINSQAYSLVMAKVRDGVNANEVAKEISENVDMRKWICVSAEKLYATNSGNIVFFIMTNEEMAKNVYDSFKTLAGTIGQVYEKTAEEEQLPPDISFPIPE